MITENRDGTIEYRGFQGQFLICYNLRDLVSQVKTIYGIDILTILN
jgi:hypothetical protein